VIRLVRAEDAGYPARVRERLGDRAPALHVAGDLALAGGPLLGVVGSRDVDENGAALAAEAGRVAVTHGWGVVSGGAAGVDRAAMDAALSAGATVVAFLADPLTPAASEPRFAHAIDEHRLCLASPYGVDVPYSAERAHGRNRLIFAAARVTLVVATEEGGSSTWLGAAEALEHGYGEVAVWTAPAAWHGNRALATLGARSVEDLDDLWSRRARWA
jgi:DNA processing protein